MAKAKVTTKSGLVVQVEGTPAEIIAVVEDLKRKEEVGSGAKRKGKAGRVQLVDLIAQLIEDDFFTKKPRDLASVKTALAELGHPWPVTTISGAMLDQVRRRNLRRLKDKRRWVYVR
jgi:hypothetical protein